MKNLRMVYKIYRDALKVSDPDTHRYLAKGGYHHHVYVGTECMGVHVTLESAVYQYTQLYNQHA